MHRTTTRLLCLLAAITLTSCAEEELSLEEQFPTVNWELWNHLTQTYGIQFGLLHKTEPVVHEDGLVESERTFAMSVDGLGATEILLRQTNYPAADGGGIMLRLKDLKAGDERLFFYYPEDNQVLFSQDVSGVDSDVLELRGTTVQREPDGTYVVIGFDDTRPDEEGEILEGQNGYEAVTLVDKYADFNTIPPYLMFAAIALGNYDLPEARSSGDPCTFPDCPEVAGQPATRPTFCSIFTQFCECAACSTHPEGASCSLCPKLSDANAQP